MANTKVQLDKAGMGELLKSSEVRALLKGPAEKALSRAKSGAPVATGAYRDSIHIESDTTDRAVERVVSDSPYAMLVESKTGNIARSL